MRWQIDHLAAAQERKSSPAREFGIGAAMAVGAVASQAGLNEALGRTYLFLFFPAAMLAVLASGFRGAIACVVVSLVGFDALNAALGSESIGPGHHRFPLVLVGASALVGAWILKRAIHNRIEADAAYGELEAVLWSISDAIVVIDRDKRVAFLNSAAETLLGWSPSRARNQSVSQVVQALEADGPRDARSWLDLLLTGAPRARFAVPVTLAARDGAKRSVEASAAPIRLGREETAVGWILNLRDVTERERAQAAIARTSEHLQLALAASGLGTFYWNVKTGEAEWSEQVYRLLGFRESERPKVDIGLYFRAVHSDDRARVESELRRSLATGAPFEVEFRVATSDGSERWVMEHARVFRDERGDPAYMLGAVQDVTERTLAKIEFEKNVDVSPAILWITDADGSCSYLSRQWQELTGQPPSQALGFGWLEAVHPDDRDLVSRVFRESNEARRPFRLEYRLRSASGEYRWAADAGNPRFDDNGAFLGFAGAVFDVHLERTHQDELRETERRLKFALRTGGMGNWSIRLADGVASISEETADLMGVDVLSGDVRSLVERLVHPDDREALIAVLTDAVARRVPFKHEYRIVRPDNGETHWLHSQARIRLSPDGEPMELSGVSLNVTERKRFELELMKAKEDAERANALKSAFVANMSHEIRTPLGAMLGFADLLRSPDLSVEERHRFIDIMARNGESLSVIIDDILDLSKVESGHMSLDYSDFSPSEVAEDVVALFRAKAQSKDVEIEYRAEEGALESMTSDPIRVRQILTNVVGNAVKFTARGFVRVRGEACETALGRKGMRFEISDSGIGVPEDQRERIFDMFVQADGSMTRRFGGTGLGLALARRLARSLGGDVVLARSEIGAGTTFQVVVEDRPERRGTDSSLRFGARRAPARAVNALKGLRVLVVDDAPDNRRLIWHYLKKQGAIVDSAENGLEGYEKAMQNAYDVVLMDIQMPEMDGFAATRKLRMAGYSKPIIALTAHAMTEVRQKCLSVGYTSHVAKPIDPDELASDILRVVGLRGAV